MVGNKRIGVFDSGLGGLFLMRSLVRGLPLYDYIYLGDTKRVPYGGRSADVVYEFTRDAIEFLFQRGCGLALVACNTASATALRRIQQDLLPKMYPTRRVLGVLVPLAEAVCEKNLKRVGVLATQATVESQAITREIQKRARDIAVYEQAAPLLVPIVESGELQWVDTVLTAYLKPLLRRRVDGIALGCTHYPVLKRRIRRIAGKGIVVVSQDDFIADKLGQYLKRHPELETALGKKRTREFLITDKTPEFEKRAKQWFGKDIQLEIVEL